MGYGLRPDPPYDSAVGSWRAHDCTEALGVLRAPLVSFVFRHEEHEGHEGHEGISSGVPLARERAKTLGLAEWITGSGPVMTHL